MDYKDFGKKPDEPFQPTGDLLRVERKLDAVLAECQWIRSLLGKEVRDESYQPMPDNTLL
jgi:hypothetical protein